MTTPKKVEVTGGGAVAGEGQVTLALEDGEDPVSEDERISFAVRRRIQKVVDNLKGGGAHRNFTSKELQNQRSKTP